MKSKEPIHPPRWAVSLLNWYCKPSLIEDLEGDLHEYFVRNVSKRGPAMAKLIYVIDVIKFFRPYTIRKPQFLQTLIHWIMLGSYIKTSGRNIVRNKLASFINIFGLSVSMAVGLLMIAMLYDLNKYDKFNEHHDRIYRVSSNFQYLEHRSREPFATTSLRAANAIKEKIPGVEATAVFHSRFGADYTFNERTVPLSGFWANEAVFDVFSFNLKEGNPQTALKEPFSIVLTETSAAKIFGDEPPLGRQVIMNNDRAYTVTGITKDLPRFSHIKFDLLTSLSTREIVSEDFKDEGAWDNMWSTWVYLLLQPDTDHELLQQNLNTLCEHENKTVDDMVISLATYPMVDIVSGEDQSNQIGPTIGNTVIRIFSGLAVVVILSACFNYTNLSIARTLRRSKEVGIRKTIGALRSHVILQFIVESVVVSLLALVIAFGLFLFLRSHYISLENSFREMLVMDLAPALIGWFIAFAIIVGVLAGAFPALFFSRLNAIQVLKNMSAVPRLKGLTIRKALIVFQYTISIIAITMTTIMYKQYKHYVAFDLGFSTENIVNIRLHGNKAELLQKEFSELAEVQEISKSSIVQSVGNHWGMNVKNPSLPLDSGTAFYNVIDESYIPIHNFKLIAGRNFQPALADSAIEKEVIINEHLLKRFNFGEQDPEKAIGETILVDRKPMTIVGVVKNFSYSKADNARNSKEVMFRYVPSDFRYLNLKIQTNDWIDTYARMEAIWKKFDNVHPFEAKLYNDEIEESFAGLKAAMKVGGFLAFLVIAIASIGLLGMVIFTTETRLKEISIRKVLGASEKGLLFLLSRGFLALLMIAALIAVPITYLFCTQIMMREVGNAAPITMLELFAGVLVVVGIAVLMITSHTLKVSRTNPAEVLKSE